MTDSNNVYVGLDVHKRTIAVAIAKPGREDPLYLGEIENARTAVSRLLKKLTKTEDRLEICYEAGPCGYGLYRQLIERGHGCEVVAPSLIPRKAGERLKTDRRDALMLARLHRSGELTAVWVPDEEQEAIRDLVRAREDMKSLELKTRQRLGAFLLRHGHVYRGKTRWTQAHFRWMEKVEFSQPVQRMVLQEYIDTFNEAQRRVAGLESQMATALETWSLGEVAKELMALRGVKLITAMTTLAELGDLTRFDSPTDLMGYIGLVPSEHSSGDRRRQGGITHAGNGHVRRVLIEAGWAYRHPARKSKVIQRRAEKTSLATQAIAWQAQKRLCARHQSLLRAGKMKNKVNTAVARELVGFIWAIVCEAKGKEHASKALA